MALFTYFTWPYLHTKKTPCSIDLFIDLLCIQLDLIQGTLLYTICLFIHSFMPAFIYSSTRFFGSGNRAQQNDFPTRTIGHSQYL